MTTPAPIFTGERTSKELISYNFGSPILLKNFSNAKRIRIIELVVETAFNVPATASVGSAGTPNLFMSSSENNLLDPDGEFVVPLDYLTSPGDQFYIFLNAPGATQGSFFVIMKFI